MLERCRLVIPLAVSCQCSVSDSLHPCVSRFTCVAKEYQEEVAKWKVRQPERGFKFHIYHILTRTLDGYWQSELEWARLTPRDIDIEPILGCSG
jgi:hypothetical protein